MAGRGAVVVTGASTGIGEATAMRLATGGFTVFAGVRKDADAERLTISSLPALRALRIDVARPDTIAAAVRDVAAAVGGEGLAGLVNNAGVTGGGPLEFTPMEDIRAMFDVNVFGTVATTQAFLPLIRQGQGRVVCTGSISGRTAVPFVGPYSMTKAAIQSMCHVLRVELRPWKIKVICVEPGSISTPLWQKGLDDYDAAQARMPPEAGQYYGHLVPRLKAMTERTARAGIPPSRVADVIFDALTAARPRPRYLVGLDSRAQSLLGRMPDRVRDEALARYIGVD